MKQRAPAQTKSGHSCPPLLASIFPSSAAKPRPKSLSRKGQVDRDWHTLNAISHRRTGLSSVRSAMFIVDPARSKPAPNGAKARAPRSETGELGLKHPPGSSCPLGTIENSPAFQGWVRVPSVPISPVRDDRNAGDSFVGRAATLSPSICRDTVPGRRWRSALMNGPSSMSNTRRISQLSNECMVGRSASVVPDGTCWDARRRDPPINRWAIFVRPSGTWKAPSETP